VAHPYLDGPYPRAYAHRGWHTGDLAGLENTMAAFRRAVDEGFHYLELDVHRTVDGEVVVHHDAVLGRLTDGTAAIADLTWPMLSTVRVGGREPIPRLADVLTELPDTRITVELKSDDAVSPTIRLLDAADCWHRVCIGSFSERRLEVVRRVAGQRALTSMGRRSAVALRVRAWYGPRRGAPGPAVRGDVAQLPNRYGRITVVDPKLMATARALGREVHVWTVDRPAEMHELLDMGVDGLLSDRPDLLRDVLRARGQWPDQRRP
jgi:glycerophosphoryl diester phosphodiesterase